MVKLPKGRKTGGGGGVPSFLDAIEGLRICNIIDKL